MTPELLNNLLRGSVSLSMYVLLLFTLTKSESSRKKTIIVTTLIFLVSLCGTFWFYVYGDLTTLSRYTVIFFIVAGIAVKSLTKQSLIKWCFTFLTSINIAMMIIILSFYLGKLFPNPQYANTMLRFVLYLLVIVLFQHYLISLYHSVVENWPMFSALILCIFLNLSYYFFATTDIQNTLLSAKLPLLFLIVLCMAAYGTVFYSLKRLGVLHALETENLKIQNDRVLIAQAASTMAQNLELMDKVAYQNSLASHDRRHFNNMLLELLQRGESEQAISYLEKQIAVKVPQSKVYCENKAVNAATSYYIEMAEQRGIVTKVNLAIPAELSFDSVELALVVSNLLENAIKGVSLLPEGQDRFIRFTCLQRGRMVLEITNPCLNDTELDETGLPVTKEDGHGIGTKSVAAFAAMHQAELMYSIEHGRFTVRLLI